jgi:hypothetical protein
VRNEDVIHRVKEERNILHTTKKGKLSLHSNCLLKHVFEGKMEVEMDVTGRRGRRRKQLVDDLKETKGYCTLKENELDRTMWKTRFGRAYGPVIRQNGN